MCWVLEEMLRGSGDGSEWEMCERAGGRVVLPRALPPGVAGDRDGVGCGEGGQGAGGVVG